MTEDLAFGPSTLSIINEAKGRGIPIIRLNDANLVQLWLWQVPGAHPGHHHVADQDDRGRHCIRQGPHQAPAGRRRHPVPKGVVIHDLKEAIDEGEEASAIRWW